MNSIKLFNVAKGTLQSKLWLGNVYSMGFNYHPQEQSTLAPHCVYYKLTPQLGLDFQISFNVCIC